MHGLKSLNQEILRLQISAIMKQIANQQYCIQTTPIYRCFAITKLKLIHQRLDFKPHKPNTLKLLTSCTHNNQAYPKCYHTNTRNQLALCHYNKSALML